MKVRIWLLLPCLALVSSAIAQAAPQPPTGRWYADFGMAHCTATRNYGTKEDPLYLILKLPPLGDVLQIGIATKGFTGLATQLDGEIVFEGAPGIETNFLEYGVRRLDQRMFVANLPLERLHPMRSASSIRLRTHRPTPRPGQLSRIAPVFTVKDYHLKLSSVGKLLETLGSCADGLRKMWNVEQPGAVRTLVKQGPEGDLSRVFSAEDYPSSAEAKGQSGSLTLAVLVDEGGKIADCTIVKTSRVAVLDAQSCAIVMQRAKFTPAVGLDGKPAKAAWTQTITWELRD
jgi:TonB family protein